MPNLYVSLNEMKHYLQELDRATEDDRILLLLEDVSRQIDAWAHHKFYVETRTRTFTGTWGDKLLLPSGADLLAVTSLKTGLKSDGTYATTWDATDYVLEPEDNPNASPPKPYWLICTSRHGTRSFSCYARDTEITGKWGFYEVLQRSAATTGEALDTSETEVDVSSGGGALLSVGHTLLVDDEQMYVSEIIGDKLTVTRGVNGTTAASHLTSSAIDVYTYPGIREAVKLQFNRYAARRDSPLGAMGSAEFGVIRLSARLDPDVISILSGGYRLRAIG